LTVYLQPVKKRRQHLYKLFRIPWRRAVFRGRVVHEIGNRNAQVIGDGLNRLHLRARHSVPDALQCAAPDNADARVHNIQ
jgi:hypothetical protein